MNTWGELRSADGTRAGGDSGPGAITSDYGSGNDAAYHSPGSYKRDQNDVSRDEAGHTGAARSSGTGSDDVRLRDRRMGGQITLAGGDIDMKLAGVGIGTVALGNDPSVGIGLTGKDLCTVEKAGSGMTALAIDAEENDRTGDRFVVFVFDLDDWLAGRTLFDVVGNGFAFENDDPQGGGRWAGGSHGLPRPFRKLRWCHVHGGRCSLELQPWRRRRWKFVFG